MWGALGNRVRASMGLKFIAALTGAIFVLLVLGALVIARLLMEGQSRALETRGKEMGQLLSKAVTDPLLHQDIITIDGLVGEAAKSQDMLYAYVTDASNKVLDTTSVSFNRSDAAVKGLLAEEKSEDVAALAAKVRQRLDAIEIEADINVGSARLGSVKMGLSRQGAQRDTRQIVWMLVGTGIILYGGIALMLVVMIRKMIVAPMHEAVTAASNIAGGDLSRSIRVRTVDELGALGRGLNSMIVGLKGMVGNVREAAQKTETAWKDVKEISAEIAGGSKIQAESVEEAASSVNEMHYSLKEIGGNVDELHKTSERTSSSVIEMAASINEVARTMTELSASIEETSTAITQMSAAVRQIAENVEVLSSAADDTAASAIEISASVKEVEANAKVSAALAETTAADAEHLGMRSIEKTIEGMSRIDTTARRTADVINRLGDRAENIGSILTVIEDITDQTALLALNAAILAAQAGEHGKGFAVVATEIRQLANRTASSTKEISALIASVQEESREAVGAMREGVAMVEEGVHLAREAGDALKKILESADQSRDMSRSINKAAAEQTRGMRQVSEAVGKITDMTHQIARAANEQKVGSGQISRASEKMRELTRFVKTSTDEQAKGSKEITAQVEDMSAKIGIVNSAAGEVQTGSDLIVRAIERIKEIAKGNADKASGLNEAMEVIAAQSNTLKREIDKFKTESAETEAAG